jgi:hypothetical protein
MLARQPVLSKTGMYDLVTVGEALIGLGFYYVYSELVRLFDLHHASPCIHTTNNILSVLNHLGSQKQCINVLDCVYSLLALSGQKSEIEINDQDSPTELMKVLIACVYGFCFCSTGYIWQTLELPL